MKTLKRTAINEVMEAKELCKFNQYGQKCPTACGICDVRDLYNKLKEMYIKRQTLSEMGQRKLYKLLIQILTKERMNGVILAGFDTFAQIAFYVALEQLRESLANHIRGVQLSNAPKLENLLTFYRRSLNTTKSKEAQRFAETRDAVTSVFNDDHGDKQDHLRRHLIHLKIDFTAGFFNGQGSLGWVKKGWQDEDTKEILLKSDSVKRKIRHSVFNEENELTFPPPEFDNVHKIYKNRALNSDTNDIAKPLMPCKVNNKTLIL